MKPGCRYACTCSGFCPSCRTYKPEEYFGHAEDLLAQAHGYQDAEKWEEKIDWEEKIENERLEGYAEERNANTLE